MCEDLLREPAPLCLVECLVKAQQPAAALQTVAGHLELVHGMDILDVQFDRRSIRRLGRPHIQILVPPSFEV